MLNFLGTKNKSLLILAVLILWNLFFLAHPVFLTPADIGRHITNGQILATTPITQRQAILHTNYYSYTHQNFAFINHHWLSGLILYFVYHGFGWLGISLFGLALSTLIFLISFDLARRASSFNLASLFAFFIIPLIAERFEVRPELFSYLFALLFVWLLTRYRQNELNWRWLITLPLLELIWVNLHIYFIIGFLILGCFWLEEIFNKNKSRFKIILLTLLGLACVGTSLINPSGWRGTLYPLTIFNNYGLEVGENQSVSTLSQTSAGYTPALLTYKLTLALLALLYFLAYRKKKLPPLSTAVWIIFLAWFGWHTVRNISLFGFFALPTIAFLTFNLTGPTGYKISNKLKTWFGIGLIILTFIFSYSNVGFLLKTRGLGLMPGNLTSANFIKQNNISGPIFNDFDSGSYIIFSLFPTIRPFVDNRAEAYPADFFKNIYLPLHTDASVWAATDQQYQFNVIYYSFDDAAPYALPFILNRIVDPAWAPVFTDQYAIVLLKRNSQNAELIKKFEIPQSQFSLENK